MWVRFPSPAVIFLFLASLSHASDFHTIQFTTSAFQGEAIHIKGEAGTQSKIEARFLEKDALCYKTSDKEWECFLAVPADAQPGSQPITILSNGTTTETLHTEIDHYPFPILPISLTEEKKSLLTREDRPEEVKRIRKALATESKEKHWKEKFVSPVAVEIESLYGEKRILDGNLQKGYHRGLDLGAPEGTPIKAANDGEVILAGPFIEEGNMVMIDHGQGLMTAYLHLSKILVGKGKKIKKGETIGKVGSTGVVNTPHLHFGTYIHGIPIDPLYLLNKFPYID